MAMRASTLGNNVLAINREIDSRYDAVIAVRDHLPEIELVAGMDFDTLIAQMLEAQDFTGITVVEGPNVSWDSINKVLVVPKGKDGIDGRNGIDGRDGINGKDGINGVNGLNGKIPVIEFQVDDEFNMTYEVVGYEDGPGSANTVQEG